MGNIIYVFEYKPLDIGHAFSDALGIALIFYLETDNSCNSDHQRFMTDFNCFY